MPGDDDAVVSFPKKPRCPSPGEVEHRLNELDADLRATQEATLQTLRTAADAHTALTRACVRQQAQIDDLTRRVGFLEHALAVANTNAPWWRRLLAAPGFPPRNPR